ncbi:unnamed protein product [Symbiodinium natans]|uniref:Uncharacterized protein n=1 Tax=Symbiodinium natans TaxID=878477 RepID=A0A812SB98_9DINO|nr:unnamed protein product [Symbiodinium natans]
MGRDKTSSKKNGKSAKASSKSAATKVCIPEPKASSATSVRKTETKKAQPQTSRKMSKKKELQVVGELIEGEIGTAAPRPMPLSALTKHKMVAWQWLGEGGQMHYPIPIGCNKPLSPFNSEDE